MSIIIIPAKTVAPGDHMDHALDKLRTAHLALAPDNKGWQDETALAAVWATLESVIRDLEPVRQHLTTGGANG